MDENRRKINVKYEDIPSEVHQIVQRNLLEEQGWLCCYTGIPLTERCSHIEHLLPRCKCHNGEDIIYTNLLAAYPGPSINGKIQCLFGAVKKGGWYDKNLFVHPLKPECETRFLYTMRGKITPRNVDYVDAVTTIEKLRLDHSELNELRKKAIDGFLYSDQKEISLARAKKIGNELQRKNYEGHFHPYCFVLEHALKEYISIKEKQHRRKIAIQKQKK